MDSTQRGAEKEGETQRWESTELAPRSGIAGKVLDSCQGVWDSELRAFGAPSAHRAGASTWQPARLSEQTQHILESHAHHPRESRH